MYHTLDCKKIKLNRANNDIFLMKHAVGHCPSDDMHSVIRINCDFEYCYELTYKSTFI